jgi:ADP-ribose pyrophosphatase YjhB (NUDIX family)
MREQDPKTEDKTVDDPVAGFLRDEYKYFSESFWKNEATGETRVQFFISFVTAVVAALGALAAAVFGRDSKFSVTAFLLICLFSFVGLLGLGIVTLFRILKRNRTTDEYKHALDTIRKLYKKRFDGKEILKDYRPLKKKKKDFKGQRKFGGLVHLIEMLNSIVLAGMASVIALCILVFCRIPLEDSAALIVGVSALIGLAAGFSVQYVLTDRTVRFTHAGGVVYRIMDGKPQFLIITAKKNREDWVLPKGHKRMMESKRRAAFREVREESGYSARIIREIGVSEYHVDDKKLRIKFYLMKLDENKPRIKAEKRETRWCARDEALGLLSFKDAQWMVKEASDCLEGYAGHEDRKA